MAGMTWAGLRALLVDRYDDIKARLTRQLGSEELASESLHETWLRLHRQGDAGPVQRPSAYILHVATNIARDALRSESRRLRRSEVDAALDIADPAPGPADIHEARRDLEVIERAIRELPDRQRAVLTASRMECLSHQEIANRLGISKRTVLYELRRAVAHLEACLDKNDVGNCTAEPPETS